MGYGHFSDDGREYVITRVPTPRPWENFISNRDYGVRVDAAGVGYSVLPVAPGNHVTATGDAFGKAFYLRDRDSGRHWSLAWHPVGAAYDRFACRHGLGYTTYEMTAEGTDTSLRVFVPVEGQVEIWVARVRNAGRERRRLTLFPYVEWQLTPHIEPWDNYRNYIEAHWVKEEGSVVATLADPARPGETHVGFACISPAAVGYDAERAAFIGTGSPAAPQAVCEGRCRDSDMPGDGRAVAAFALDLDLAPGEEQVAVLLVGFCADPAERARLREKYLGSERADEAFAAVRSHWDGLIEQPKVKTPDPRLDRMTNIWLKANIVQLNGVLREGLRGYRDTLQDAMGVVSFDPDCARRGIVTALGYQCADGHAPRQFSYAGGPHDLRVYNDSPLWIVLALTRYLRETGELSLLEAAVPFFESAEEGTVFEHARRAIDWIDARRGLYDLIRIDHGDWCDALDQVGRQGKGVSIWLSQAFHLCLLDFAELCALRGEEELAAHYRGRAAELRDRIEQRAWDGEWYLCAISDRGRRLGARGERAMEIYLNTQSWAVIGRVADKGRAAAALKAADERLETRYGPLLLDPPFHEYDPEVGRLSVLRPGCGENGTVYVHAATFYLLANLMARRPERALEILHKLAPMMEAHDPDITLAAPYAYVNSYVGPCHPTHEGQTLTNWYTSSASWTLFAITDWLLGVRPTYEGLLIDPCLPASWEGAALRRRWRGAEYEVAISKPKGIVDGDVRLRVDGKEHPGNLIPPHGDGKLHQVAVSLAPS